MRKQDRQWTMTLVFGLLLALPIAWTLPARVAGKAPAQIDPELLPLPTCREVEDPFLATTNFVIGRQFEREPAILAFRGDSDEDSAIGLATVREVGAVYGLAVDAARARIYAGAYHKRNSHHGPAGPGGVYEVALDGSGVRTLLRVPDAGRDMHDADGDYHPDERARAHVGKTSLGDVEMDAAGAQLFVMNLEARRIERFSLPDGRHLGSLDHGAAGETWADDARPFGLAWREGWLYHGLVRSALSSQSRQALFGYVYASRADGSAMQRVAELDLRYDRGRHEAWNPWPRRENDDWLANEYPQPMLTDIAFDAAGNLIVGLRDRHIDTGPSLAELYRRAPGDVLRLAPEGAMRWGFDASAPEHYFEDHLDGVHDEIAMGGLVQLLHADIVVSTVIDPFRTHREGTNIGAVSAGALWLENPGGSDQGRVELVYNARRHDGPHGKAIGLGDLEMLCLPPTPTPTASTTASATSTPTMPSSATPSPPPSRTPTSTASATLTVTASASPTATPWIIYLPFAERGEPCRPEARRADLVLVLDQSTSMQRPVAAGGRAKGEAAIAAARAFAALLELDPTAEGGGDRLGLVGFNDRAWTEIGLSADRAAVASALDRLPARMAEGTRLDSALLEGQAVLDADAGRMPNRQPVMVLLTDGLPNRVPFGPGSDHPGCPTQECSVLAEAEWIKSAGTRVFTIGLGEPSEVLRALLLETASEPADYYFAPDGEDLQAIYRQIAGRVRSCPG